MDHPRKEWLLCFDFDGTLIDPKKSQEIDPLLQKALSLIREKKAAIVINTGPSLMEAVAGIHQCGIDFQPDYITCLLDHLLFLYIRRLQKIEYHWKNTYNFFSMDTTSSTNASKPQQSTRT